MGAIAVLTNVTALAAAAGCAVAVVRRGGRIRFAWAALGLGILGSVLPSGAAPGTGSFGHLILVAFVAVSLFAVPRPRPSRLSRLRGVVDALLIATSLLVSCYNFVLQPAMAADAALSPSHPLADVLLGSVALSALARCRRGYPGVAVLLMTGVATLLMAVADATAVRLRAESLGGWLVVTAVVYLAGHALVLVAAVHASRSRLDEMKIVQETAAHRRNASVLLPYVVVVSTLLAGFVWVAAGGVMTQLGTWCRFLSIFLIVVREAILLADNRGLARRLEERVAARTAELQGREQRFRALVEQSSDSLAILEADSTVRYQSSSIERIFGYPVEALVGRRLIETSGRRAGAVIEAAIGEVVGVPGASITFPVTLRHADGVRRLAEMTITNLLDDPYVKGLVFNTRDVSEAKELQNQLRHEAYHDALTGLVNRSLFRERLGAAVARHESRERVAILFLDLDGFKEINDSLGHAAGDQLLVQVAARLLVAVSGDHTVARLGGDEFAVIVESPESDAPAGAVAGALAGALADAEVIAGAILAALDVPFILEGREVHAGAGIGIASAAQADDIEQLQRNADLAMYRAKDAGGGVFAAYHPRMHDALMQRLELARDLRTALDRDELTLHYQPTVNLRTGEIVGFEALVRWNHPERGLVPPLDFIGVAESTGLIVPLGRWVLTEACRQAVAWDRPLKMAVNVSVRQFEAGDLAATVSAVLAETGMPPHLLTLEMTESVLLTDTDENLARIVALKSLGVRLAMDDFGTGYSSLAYLRRFPMDVLKIDRSFVDRLGGDTEDEALVRTIVSLGRRFGMCTVAEGIENAAQLAVLRDMGCDYAQGYYLSRPLPAAAATALLTAGLPIFELAS
jgi:diguanylate cyclase (GGDEF)-like protein/PAS domain S-box-containing protein